jgi:hypothetical protein
MIGRRGFQNVEPPRASPGPFRAPMPLASEDKPPLDGENRTRLPAAVPRRARDPPEPGQRCRDLSEIRPLIGNTSPLHGAGPAEAPPAQANQSPPRIDYGTESVVTTYTTSARAQCKSPVSRPSCGIVPTDGALSAIRASQVGP